VKIACVSNSHLTKIEISNHYDVNSALYPCEDVNCKLEKNKTQWQRADKQRAGNVAPKNKPSLLMQIGAFCGISTLQGYFAAAWRP
jgi:hypothetical protein